MKIIIPFLLIGIFVILLSVLLFSSNTIENISGYFLLDVDENVIEKDSPYDRIKEEQIKVYKSLIIMHINDSELITLENTNSMDPLIDEKSNAIQVKPKDDEDIHIGDIVSYEDSSKRLILHRVVGIGEDKNGKYYILRGDNADSLDQIKVRFGQIKGVVVGILY
jgi:hypothetical protein